MSLEGFVLGALASVGIILLIYIIVRVGTFAFFRSKQDHENRR